MTKSGTQCSIQFNSHTWVPGYGLIWADTSLSTIWLLSCGRLAVSIKKVNGLFT